MSRDYKPAETPQLTPYLTVASPEASLEFYQKAFGFTPKPDPLRDEQGIVHAEMSYLEASIMMGRQGAMGGEAQTPSQSNTVQGIGLYIYCPDVDAHFAHAKDFGAEILTPPEDMFWGDRMYTVADNDGYQWSFAQNVGEFDPSKIPGTNA